MKVSLNALVYRRKRRTESLHIPITVDKKHVERRKLDSYEIKSTMTTKDLKKKSKFNNSIYFYHPCMNRRKTFKPWLKIRNKLIAYMKKT